MNFRDLFERRTHRLARHWRRFDIPAAQKPFRSITGSKTLNFILVTDVDRPAPGIEPHAMVRAGQLLGPNLGIPVASPVTGEVVGVFPLRNLPYKRAGLRVEIRPEPVAETSPGFPPLTDITPAGADKLWERLDEAGISTFSEHPRGLPELLMPEQDPGIKTLVIAAEDVEPFQISEIQLLRERRGDLKPTVELFRALLPDAEIIVATAKSEAERTRPVLAGMSGVRVFPVDKPYPETVFGIVAMDAVGPDAPPASVAVISLETALAAMRAVYYGEVPLVRHLTVIGPPERKRHNCRIPIGTSIQTVLDACEINLHEGDKVILGGPMMGWSAHSLDMPIDARMTAITVIPAKDLQVSVDEPCVNCGRCISVCPMDLQPQLLGRYAEFGLYEQAQEFGALNCVECGLCAYVCISRRPLIQWFKLAKLELAKLKLAEEEDATLEPDEQEFEESEPAGNAAPTGGDGS